MNRYAAGNQIKCPFYFAIRPLTIAEEKTFLIGGGLPSGVGLKPSTVHFIYTPPEGEETTVEGAGVIEDAVGAYHSIITAAIGWEGTVTYKGRALNGEVVIATSTPRVFSVGP